MSDLELALTEITQSVWRSTLGLEVTRSDRPDLAVLAFPCLSTVRLGGAWTGSLTIACPSELARSVGKEGNRPRRAEAARRGRTRHKGTAQEDAPRRSQPGQTLSSTHRRVSRRQPCEKSPWTIPYRFRNSCMMAIS